MGEESASRPDVPPIPAAERLVNLTPHEIAIRVSELPRIGEDHDHAWPGMVRITPAGRFARVDDVSGPTGEWLNVGTALAKVARLRRSRRVTDLPAPVPGTRYVVSRLTAQAARHRADLVFPFGEERDEAGRIIGVNELANYRRTWAPRQSWRDWRVSARAVLIGQPLGREWPTGVLFATATAFLSGFLALVPGVADNAVDHGWASGGQAVASWASVAFLMAGAAALALGAQRWRKRAVILGERGTAYVIDEIAMPWQHEEKESFLASVRANFAPALVVPGPSGLGDSWHWQTDPGTAGRWDEQVDTLVRSFWAVHYNDDKVTRNALFTWAPWPVAVAFAARATFRRRGLVLNVRQRPSYGAAGPTAPPSPTDPPHDFLLASMAASLADAAPAHTVTCLREELSLTFETLTAGSAAGSSPRGPGASHHDEPGPAKPPLLLVVRVVHGDIGAIPMDLATAPAVKVHMPANLAAVIPARTCAVPVAEWRLDSAATPIPQLPWPAFPAAAQAIAKWIIDQADAHPGRTVLLAARIPQEIGMGLGILLGQLQSKWPERLYPVVYAHSRLVVPELRLGRDAVRTERS